jgi:5S rRNA maturation endonuclease (ribonuclease M5)
MILITDILSRTSEKEIMEFYWGERLLVNRAIYKNPMRYDDTGTCYFFWSNGKFKFADRARSHYFDCFDYVQWLFKCNLREALIRINTDMSLNRTEQLINSAIPIHKTKSKKKVSFKIKLREWNNYDRDYWAQFGINIRTVNKICKPVQEYSSNSNSFNFTLKYKYDYLNPCYVYTFRKNVKLYCPYSKTNKWSTNTDVGDIFGYDNLPSFADSLFITSGGKDMMCMWEMGFNAIAFQSEVTSINEDLLEQLKQRFKSIYILYDNDEAGIRLSAILCDKYKLTNIILPKIDKAKDIAEFCQRLGLNKVKEIINGKCNKTIDQRSSTTTTSFS